ncbi:hypothetical protein SPF06_20340 [Sinomonas sp. JGH33]|uniref:Response regulatory domain-containing protein n=1 Tax=Sinomonas terricola TaxID=3110330 RepID=A0ABU5TC65_9MICC|nr:hypothetical protein [Sinomonas sp. JGH33]MEA5457079.1 hypothetical protein [Sinomonas sp. JGH33]
MRPLRAGAAKSLLRGLGLSGSEGVDVLMRAQRQAEGKAAVDDEGDGGVPGWVKEAILNPAESTFRTAPLGLAVAGTSANVLLVDDRPPLARCRSMMATIASNAFSVAQTSSRDAAVNVDLLSPGIPIKSPRPVFSSMK